MSNAKDDETEYSVRAVRYGDVTELKDPYLRYRNMRIFLEKSGDIGLDDLNCFAFSELLQSLCPHLGNY